MVAADLGGGRAWSAAVSLWPNGRLEGLALAPGVPNLEAQEKRDRVPSGTYRALAATGKLMIAHGLDGCNHLSQLWATVRSAWGRPAGVICDRFRLAEMQDAVGGAVPVIRPRVSRWSEAAFDIRSLRKMAKDGPLSVDPSSRPLLAASLAAAHGSRMTTKATSGFGETRKQQRKREMTFAAALVLDCGRMGKARVQPPACTLSRGGLVSWRSRPARRPPSLGKG